MAKLLKVFDFSDFSGFRHKFYLRRHFVFFSLLIFIGIFFGSLISSFTEIFAENNPSPIFFSDIPDINKGVVVTFSDLLFHTILIQFLIFFLSATVFGVFLIPMVLLLKGITIGIGMTYIFFNADGFPFLKGAILYAPGCSLSLLFLLFFSSRAIDFSKGIAASAFSSNVEKVNITSYIRDFLFFSVLAVLPSLNGTMFAAVYTILFL